MIPTAHWNTSHATGPYDDYDYAAEPRPEAHLATAMVWTRIEADVLRAACRLWSANDSLRFGAILNAASRHLGEIARHVVEGRIDPSLQIRVRTGDPELPAPARRVRLGVFPVNGNPPHWGHILCALSAMAELELDRVVFLVQGFDPRKPASAATEPARHEMARMVAGLLAPLAEYSDVGMGNDRVGEENLFSLLRLNPGVQIDAYYLVGSDHYRVCDALGRPDTLPRIEHYMADPERGFDASMHSVRVAFIERSGSRRLREVATSLEVLFLAEALDSSSTRVRDGDLALTPDVVVTYLTSHPDYARGIHLHGFWPASSAIAPAAG